MKLIVLTKQFGNYTGATVSTIQLLNRINKYFDEIIVFTTRTDGTKVSHTKLKVAKINDLKRSLRKLNSREYIGYSDDHYGYLFKQVNIKYIHTYHGNWPDAKWLNPTMFLKSFYFIPLYKETIKESSETVSVSNYMNKKFVSKYTKNSIVIYNGIKQRSIHQKNIQQNKFVMVGNIDKRKYQLALQLFKKLPHNFPTVDIYGDIIDQSIAKKLSQFSFINLCGIKTTINYGKYQGLICTSKSENLPVSIVEALRAHVPVYSFDVGGISEIVCNGQNGYLFNTNETAEFAKCIISNHRKFKFDDDPQFNWDYAAQKYYREFVKVNNE